MYGDPPYHPLIFRLVGGAAAGRAFAGRRAHAGHGLAGASAGAHQAADAGLTDGSTWRIIPLSNPGDRKSHGYFITF